MESSAAESGARRLAKSPNSWGVWGGSASAQALPDNNMIVYPLKQLRRPQIPFYQRTQPSWWRPKGMASALYNSSKQALCKPISASERGGKGISRTTLSWSEVCSDFSRSHQHWAINLWARTSVSCCQYRAARRGPSCWYRSVRTWQQCCWNFMEMLGTTCFQVMETHGISWNLGEYSVSVT